MINIGPDEQKLSPSKTPMIYSNPDNSVRDIKPEKNLRKSWTNAVESCWIHDDAVSRETHGS